MVKSIESINTFAELCYDLLKSDRDVVIGTGGMTGEGKSVFLALLLKEYQKIRQQEFSFECMTWSRKELLRWIDGEGDNHEGRLPEYSPIIADELFRMFYARTWFEEGQIDAISTFNSCRDRHLLVAGNIPNFWDLDGGFRSRVRFYVYIPKRGIAWIFQQENNPFSKDNWNVQENLKLFRKKKNPYSCPNFVFEVHYPDLTDKEREEYYAIRNNKRLHMNDDHKEKQEKYGNLIKQRNIYIKALITAKPELTLEEVGELGGLSKGMVSMINNGLV